MEVKELQRIMEQKHSVLRNQISKLNVNVRYAARDAQGQLEKLSAEDVINGIIDVSPQYWKKIEPFEHYSFKGFAPLNISIRINDGGYEHKYVLEVSLNSEFFVDEKVELSSNSEELDTLCEKIREELKNVDI
jgi:hypothetical protein